MPFGWDSDVLCDDESGILLVVCVVQFSKKFCSIEAMFFFVDERSSESVTMGSGRGGVADDTELDIEMVRLLGLGTEPFRPRLDECACNGPCGVADELKVDLTLAPPEDSRLASFWGSSLCGE